MIPLHHVPNVNVFLSQFIRRMAPKLGRIVPSGESTRSNTSRLCSLKPKPPTIVAVRTMSQLFQSVRPTCGRNPYRATRHKQLPACVKSAFNKKQLNAQDAFAKLSSCRPAEQVSFCITENAHRRVTTNDAEHRAQLVFDNGGVKPVTA